jgi:hypothetical protein
MDSKKPLKCSYHISDQCYCNYGINGAEGKRGNEYNYKCKYKYNKKGSTNTAIFGTLKYPSGKCTGQNGGTIAAGENFKSNSGVQGPNSNSHFGGFIKR